MNLLFLNWQAARLIFIEIVQVRIKMEGWKDDLITRCVYLLVMHINQLPPLWKAATQVGDLLRDGSLLILSENGRYKFGCRLCFKLWLQPDKISKTKASWMGSCPEMPEDSHHTDCKILQNSATVISWVVSSTKWEKLLQQCSFSLPFVFWASSENIYSTIYSGLHEREFGARLQSQMHSSPILPPRISSGQIQTWCVERIHFF